MDLIKGIEIKDSKLSILQPVLSQWIKNIKQYCDTTLDGMHDAPYWYNERATLSTLAGAIWAAGGIVLEEYRATKGKGRGEWEGRIDLWFRHRERMFVAEAKQLWFRINKQAFTDSFIEKLTGKLQDAKRDVRKVSDEEGDPLSIVFTVPSISVNLQESRNKIIKVFIEEIRKFNYGACAWSFPSSVRTLVWEDNNSIYPGVVLVIDRLKK